MLRATTEHIILRNDVHPFPLPFHAHVLSAHCVPDPALGQQQMNPGPAFSVLQKAKGPLIFDARLTH